MNFTLSSDLVLLDRNPLTPTSEPEHTFPKQLASAFSTGEIVCLVPTNHMFWKNFMLEISSDGFDDDDCSLFTLHDGCLRGSRKDCD